MNKFLLLLIAVVLVHCKKTTESEISKDTSAEIEEQSLDSKEPELVVEFKGQQVTGVTVSDKGRLFANFPRWREGVINSVVEVVNGEAKSYPDESWNNWEIGKPLKDSVFVAVQSVVACKNKLYVLDTRNPLFQGVQGAPRIFVFDLSTNKPDRIYVFNQEGYHKDSYINDIRIDESTNRAYFTDSGHAGLVVLDLESGIAKRVLDNHPSTLAETNELIIGETIWKNTVHSDGIALDTTNNLLYYHSLTGYTLYAVPTKVLSFGTDEEVQKSILNIQKTPAPDGMIFDRKGNLYLADLEKNTIVARDSEGNLITIAEGEKVRWADTFSIYNNELYYTNSRIHEAGKNVNDLTFSIYKIKLL